MEEEKHMGQEKYIGAMTRGVATLAQDNPDLMEKIVAAFAEKSREADDWFYAIEVDGQRFFVADNGEMGCTVMLPEEY